MQRQKLMILGAGPFQLGVIESARRLGAETIVLSNNQHDPGLAVADKPFLCSTIDLDGVLQIAKQQRIDGVMTAASEVAAVTAGYVSEELGLEGFGHETAATIANKYRLRDFLRRNDIPHPRFGRATTEAEALAVFRTLQPPVMVKPTSASGSRGVHRVSNEQQLLRVVEQSLESSILDREVIIEEFLDGYEIGGEVMVRDGTVAFFAPTKKYLNEHHVPYGHLLPSGIDDQTKGHVLDLLATVISALGIRNGPLNFDLMIDDDGRPTIIELGGRLGGNCLPDLMKYHTATDTVRLAVELALGRDPATPISSAGNPVTAFIIGANRPGRVKRIKPFDQVAPTGTRLIKSEILVRAGDQVHSFTQGNLQLGYHLIAADHPADLLGAMNELRDVEWVEYQH